jgi:hypothetical protein
MLAGPALRMGREAPVSSQTPPSSRFLRDAICNGVGYLANQLLAEGPMLWRDFALADGSSGSTEWVAGFMAAHLGEIEEGQALARAVGEELVRRVRPVGGWAYREGVMSDCDSTAWVLLGVARSGASIAPAIKRRVLGVVLNHQTEAGGFATYAPASRPLFDEIHLRAGWFDAQPCVAAAAGLALLEAGRVSPRALSSLWSYLRQAAEPSALWSPYWWQTFTYATYLACRVLLQARAIDAAELARVRAAVVERRNADGGWGNDGERCSNAFATAYALLTLRLGRAAPLDEVERSALTTLLASQRCDGSFAGAATLRIPGGVGEEIMILTDGGRFTSACVLRAMDEVRPWLDR